MRVSVKTVGCRLNQAESALIAAQFEAYDCEIVPFKNDCELCVINTCTVTKKAELSCIQICKSLKKRKSSTFVILAGCAVNVADKTFAKRSGADLLVNRDEKFNIPALLSKHFPSMRKISTKTDIYPSFS